MIGGRWNLPWLAVNALVPWYVLAKRHGWFCHIDMVGFGETPWLVLVKLQGCNLAKGHGLASEITTWLGRRTTSVG